MFPLAQISVTEQAGLLSGLNGEQKLAVCIISIVCLTAITVSTVAILVNGMNKLHRRTSEDQLKRDMLDRGMTADEIDTVIKATPPSDFSSD